MIAIVVPDSVEQSGLVVFADRLSQEFRHRGIHTNLIGRRRSNTGVFNPSIHLAASEELAGWFTTNREAYEVIYWAGFMEDYSRTCEQIRLSILLRKNFKKRIFFLWEQTGSIRVRIDDESLRHLVQEGTDGIIAFNHEQLEDLHSRNVPVKLIHLLSPGVDTAVKFTPVTGESERLGLRRVLGLPEEPIIVLFLGRLAKRKRIDWLVSEWTREECLRKRAQLVVIGTGFGQKDSVEQEVLEVAQNDTTISAITDIFRFGEEWVPYYRAADLFVLPGILEGEPTVLSEAMACGLPAIASDIPGHRRLVINGETGLLFESNNSAQLKSALRLLIEDDLYCAQLGKNARRLIVQQRSIETIADLFLNVFSKPS